MIKRRRSSGIYLALAAAVLALGVGLAVFLVKQDHARHTEEMRAALAEEALKAADGLRNAIFEMELVANGLAASIAAAPDLQQPQFAMAARRLVDRRPEIMNVAAAPDLKVSHVFPLEGNEDVIGLDYRMIPEQLPSVARALRARASVIEGPVRLLQGGRGFILRKPVYVPRPAGGDRLWGIVSLVMSEHGMVHRINDDTDAQFAIRALAASGQPAAILSGDAAVFEADPVLQPVAFETERWELGLIPENGWPTTAPNREAILAITLSATVLLFGGVLWIRRVAREREEARDLLLHAIEAMNDGFAIYDQRDRLVMCNSRYRAIHGPAATLLTPGAPFVRIVREAVRMGVYAGAKGREHEWVRERLQAHRRCADVVEQQLSDGRWIKISEARTPHGYTVGQKIDVTELKEAERAAERANRGKTEFLNNVTHELRTPLTIILGYATFLGNPRVLPQAKRLGVLLDAGETDRATLDKAREDVVGAIAGYGRKIEGSARHLLHMVNEILDWAQVEHDRMTLHRAPVPARDLVRETVDEFRQQAADRGLALTFECDSACGEVLADPVRMKQVLYNLIGNAMKFTTEGGVRVSVGRDGDRTSFVIEDTGCGISRENIDMIFERFRQVDGSDTRRHGGTGLGLAIARHIVDLHGGTLRVTSEIGKGSRFSFDLPDPVCDAAVAEEVAEAEEPQAEVA
ncbi:ATP-binding protein [Tranquillimonas alkanivorans]|uniref:ATP-binding protein n=1 Tax=Tranquillimonas alkanivorans TaxID=441119 RepID=UPI001160C1A7|nr:ATP-binding protein [Tranquillimonas alkanivorans]